MSITKKLNPDYVFETSWEVCNKVGAFIQSLPPKQPAL